MVAPPVPSRYILNLEHQYSIASNKDMQVQLHSKIVHVAALEYLRSVVGDTAGRLSGGILDRVHARIYIDLRPIEGPARSPGH